MYLLEHVEIVNLVNLEGESPLYCATLLRDDRKLFDLIREKIHQWKLAMECKLAAVGLVRFTPFHNQSCQNSKWKQAYWRVTRLPVHQNSLKFAVSLDPIKIDTSGLLNLLNRVSQGIRTWFSICPYALRHLVLYVIVKLGTQLSNCDQTNELKIPFVYNHLINKYFYEQIKAC